jgi:hypothetical protein
MSGFESIKKKIMNLEKNLFQKHEGKHGYCYRPRIVCNDGFDMSVQGSKGHCNPRTTQDYYSEMEIDSKPRRGIQ